MFLTLKRFYIFEVLWLAVSQVLFVFPLAFLAAFAVGLFLKAAWKCYVEGECLMNLKMRFKYYFVDEFLGAVSAWTMDKALQAKALQNM